MAPDLEVIDAQVGQELVVAAEVSPPANLFRTDDPSEVVERASKTAAALSDVLKRQRLTTTIQGREHVRVEGWTLLGTMLGVFPVCVWTHKLDNGWEARVEARTLAGAIVGAAEAECLRSERTWASRDDYALRSMAQTRATSKALRQPLGFVVSLAGFDPTPAEEMTFDSGAGHRQDTGEKTGSVSQAASAGSTPAPDPFAGDPSRVDGPPASPAAGSGVPASPAKLAHAKALIVEAAKLRKTTQKAVKDALGNDGYNLSRLSDAQADEVIGKLERWVRALHAQEQLA